MKADELRAFLAQRQANATETAVQHGTQFRCPTGEIFTVYGTGAVSVQGKPSDLAEAVNAWARSDGAAPAIEAGPRPAPAAAQPGLDRRVFIVNGHDTAARENLELVLHRMGLEPIVLQNLPAAGDTIIEKLERHLGESNNVGFACALLTPDDEGHKAGQPQDRHYRARQNVVLELGMVLARLGRRRVAILTKESVERPSDIAGLIYISFKERVDEVAANLHRELRTAGYTLKPL